MKAYSQEDEKTMGNQVSSVCRTIRQKYPAFGSPRHLSPI